MEKMNGYVRFSNEEILEMRKNPKNVEVIVENSVGFVKSCLKGIYLSSDYSYDDKLQVAYGGLLIAIEKFDENQSNFYGFAKRCIQTELFNVHRGYTRAKRGYDKETNEQIISVCSLDIQNNDGDSIVENVEDINTYIDKDLMNGVTRESVEANMTLADKWIISRANNVVKEVTDNMDKFDLGIAAQKIYDFAWSEYCDWYIEIVKPRLYSDDKAAKQTALYTLTYVLDITDEGYQLNKITIN